MALTDVKARNAKPGDKPVKLFDGDGMFLLVTPAGGKLWRLKYRFGGKEKLLALGTYPEISLADARQRREDARKLLANGVDPSEFKKAVKAAEIAKTENTFQAVALEWHEKFAPTWADSHSYWVKRRLELDIIPVIGAKPIDEIKAPEVLAMLRRIEVKGKHETAHRVKIVCGQVLRYAVATGRAERDCTSDLKGALTPPKQKHHAAITDPKQVAELLRAIDGYQGSFVVKCALKLAPLVFVRPGELRAAEWSEIDLDAAEWNIPIERMKLKKRVKDDRKGERHLVPLSRQAVQILSELKQLTGESRYVFTSGRSFHRCMSENAILAALHRMGFDKEEMTGHGFRAMARTILDEVLQVRPDLIEHQLAHAVRDANGRAYNRTSHLTERRKMMETWSEYLEGLKSGAKVLPLKRAEG